MRFEKFCQYCASMPSFRVLERFLVPRIIYPLEYFGSFYQEVYVLMEQTILESSLRWKINLVTISSFLYELFCTHKALSSAVDGECLDKLI